MKPFRVVTFQYAERVCDLHYLAKYLSPPSTKGVSFESASWDVRDKEFSNKAIRVATKGRLSLSILDELEDNRKDYCSILHEEWCDLLSTIEVKENRKKASDQIKRLLFSKEAPIIYDSDESIRVPHKNKSRTGVLTERKQHRKNMSKH